MATGVGLLNLPPVLVPKAPKSSEGEDFLNWSRNLTNAVETLRQGLDSLAEPYISSSAQVDSGIVFASEIQAGSIRAEHITVTGAIITQAIQVQDAVITNAKIVTLDGQKIIASSITATQIAANTITAAEISTTGSIITQTAQVADAIITGAKIANLTVGAANIADGAIVNAKIGNLSVDTAKITDLSVTTLKIGNNAVTNAKINDVSAAKITTGLLVVNPSTGGATAIFVDNAGVIRMKSISGTPSRIDFETTAGVVRAKISGKTSALSINPQGNNDFVLELGDTSAAWINILARITNVFSVSGYRFALDCRFSSYQIQNFAPGGALNRRLPVYDGNDNFMGYIAIYS